MKAIPRQGGEALFEPPPAAERSLPTLDSLSKAADNTWHIPRGLLRRLYPLLTEMWQWLDAVMVGVALYALARINDISFDKRYVVLLGLTATLMFLVYSWSDLFYRLRTRTLIQESGRLLHAWAVVLVLLMGIGYVTATQREFPRQFMLSWAAVAYVAQLLIHIAIRKSVHAMRQRGYNIRRSLVVGCGAPLARYASFINQNPWLGIRIEGYVAEPSWLAENSTAERRPFTSMALPDLANENQRAKPRAAATPSDAPGIVGGRLLQLGNLSDINRLVEELSISEICVTLPLERCADAETAMRALVSVPVDVQWIPDFSIANVLSIRTDNLDGLPLVLLSDSRIDRHGQLVKRIEDVVLSALFLVLLAPLMVALAWAIKCSSPGPVLFKQRRHGLGGQPIEVWKFRTMRHSTHEIERQAAPADDRITAIGAWLRRWSLDELPQLFNVLQGRMSLVGPRPHPLWLNDQFSKLIDRYMQRHRVKPGLTGWAQVRGFRGETDSREKMERRVACDLYYITHWSPWLDMKTLARTLPAVLSGKNSR